MFDSIDIMDGHDERVTLSADNPLRPVRKGAGEVSPFPPASPAFPIHYKYAAAVIAILALTYALAFAVLRGWI